MASVLRSLFPISPTKVAADDDDEDRTDYSFAMEYTGPPISYDIPFATPLEFDRIPSASVIAMASPLNNLPVPVIQPISKIKAQRKELPVESNLVDAINSTRLSTSGGCDKHSVHLPDGIESSGTLGFSDKGDDNLYGSSDVEFQESCSSSPAMSFKSSKCEMEELDSPSHSRPPIVTFRSPESIAIVHEENFGCDELSATEETEHPTPPVKKGLCHRCLKGNRFVAKEICIVCDAKYCSKCVLRAMGSMPEGRKCITCIRNPINESKRSSLGKCSWMLKRLLTRLEIEQIMKSELSCQANQLPFWLVNVNGRPLSLEEFAILQTCANPPKSLKPGNYWYDKVAGFWGKEGYKPCQIISPQLAVGGPITREASNGNTRVLINSREITKSELLMLKLARIDVDGCPHFWVNEDGTYLEEGQNRILGNIWEKTGIKPICVALSLPMPPEPALSPNVVNNGDKHSNSHAENLLNKLLLLGHDQSGSSTIFKQAKILYNVSFSELERQNFKSMIQSQIYGYLGLLLEARKQFEEERSVEIKKQIMDQPSTSAAGNFDQIAEKNIYSIGPRLGAFSDLLLQTMMSGDLETIFPAATREYSPTVEELWKDRAFQATYNRRLELKTLPRAANYFLQRAVEISRVDYEPSDMDILNADGITSSNGLTSMEFSFPKPVRSTYMDPDVQNDYLRRYQLIRVHSSSLGENLKWLEMFEDVNLVLYCVDLTCYDQFYQDSNGVFRNKMLDSRNIFESIVNHPTFEEKNFLLLLNKFDLLGEKIEKVPLTVCSWFSDFNPLIGHHRTNGRAGVYNPVMTQCAFHYIAIQFKRLFDNLTGRKLYVSAVTGLEGDTVDAALRYGKEILKWEDEEKPNKSVTEWSTESTEETSS